MLDDAMPERRRRDMLTPLLLSLAVIVILAFWVFKPFILVFAVSACVALLLAPAQKRLDKALGGKPTLAAAILVLLTTVVILIPILTSLFLLARQTALFLDWIRLQPLLGPEEMQRFWEELPRRYPGLKSWIAFLQAQVTHHQAADLLEDPQLLLRLLEPHLEVFGLRHDFIIWQRLHRLA